ncbi:DUF1173 domain-containing protein [Ciceribacter thiooxidans]|uniref:DUF1173 domain-containing protein n=1 Tax=Ciceribacter thiooxidans TaxID=1969821 RepID=A0ABV7I9N2_9HYPH|nr:DUF1173 domain-containing protein [Ciceribacter thiooxidans]
MRRFLIDGRIIDGEPNAIQSFLSRAYEQETRPHCLCREPPIPMYIARVEGNYIVKRMPLSGRAHDPSCPSYDPPYELSGLGPLVGGAIRIGADGRASLRLDFPITKRGSRKTPSQPIEPAEAPIRNEAKKLSLRAVLHYLWEVGELTEWRSSWAGKRGWGRVRASVLGAAAQMTVQGKELSELLFVPEVFHPDDKAGIATRRTATLAAAQASGTGPRRLMLTIAEVKEFKPGRDSQRATLRHLPFPLIIEEAAWQRLNARFKPELELWRSSEDHHLILIATFGISACGVATIEELAVMVVNENWIPFENVHEQLLLKRLSGLRRKSIKGLRFNLTRDRPIVSVTLPDLRPAPVAMFIVPAAADENYERIVAEMTSARPEIASWVWRVADGHMPRLP